MIIKAQTLEVTSQHIKMKFTFEETLHFELQVMLVNFVTETLSHLLHCKILLFLVITLTGHSRWNVSQFLLSLTKCSQTYQCLYTYSKIYVICFTDACCHNLSGCSKD